MKGERISWHLDCRSRRGSGWKDWRRARQESGIGDAKKVGPQRVKRVFHDSPLSNIRTAQRPVAFLSQRRLLQFTSQKTNTPGTLAPGASADAPYAQIRSTPPKSRSCLATWPPLRDMPIFCSLDNSRQGHAVRLHSTASHASALHSHKPPIVPFVVFSVYHLHSSSHSFPPSFISLILVYQVGVWTPFFHFHTNLAEQDFHSLFNLSSPAVYHHSFIQWPDSKHSFALPFSSPLYSAVLSSSIKSVRSK